jgi:hypothetical protein
MITYVLAFVLLNNLADTAPKFVKGYTTGESCRVEAEVRNRSDERLREVEWRMAGAEYVCLHVERVMI